MVCKGRETYLDPAAARRSMSNGSTGGGWAWKLLPLISRSLKRLLKDKFPTFYRAGGGVSNYLSGNDWALSP